MRDSKRLRNKLSVRIERAARTVFCNRRKRWWYVRMHIVASRSRGSSALRKVG